MNSPGRNWRAASTRPPNLPKPLSKPHSPPHEILRTQQSYEVQIIKGILSPVGGLRTDMQKDPALAFLIEALHMKLEASLAHLDSDVRTSRVPVKHTLTVALP
jgi:hypothetical protein